MTAGHMSWVVFIGHCLPCKVRSEVRIWGKFHCPRALSHASACSIELCRSSLGYILFYDADAVHVLSVGCTQGRPGISVVMDLFESFRLLKSVGGLMNADRGHQETRNIRGHELVIPQIYRRPNLTRKLLILKWNIRDERQNTVEQTIKKDMLKWVKRKS